MRQRIYVRMPFPYEDKYAEIAAKVAGKKLWKDNIRFVRVPTLFKN